MVCDVRWCIPLSHLDASKKGLVLEFIARGQASDKP